jgi:hypothetical protein
MLFRKTSLFALALVVAVPSNAQNSSYRPNWKWIKADNGAQVAIDMKSIAHTTDGGSDAVVYFDEGPNTGPQNMRRWIFDCRGHYRDTASLGVTLYAPPHSVAGTLANIACEGAKDSRFDQIPLCETDPAKRDKQSLCRSYTH